MKKLLWALATVMSLSAAPVFAQTTSPAPSSTPNKNSNAATSEKPGEKLDINSASAEQLRELKGVGPARAEAIIKGRPYSGKDDLVRRKIIPQSVYDQIQDQIVARQKHK
jgi:DNA uptake protein ComE-like DNA-binding protein